MCSARSGSRRAWPRLPGSRCGRRSRRACSRAACSGTAGAGPLRGTRGAFDGAADPAPDGFVRARPRSARPRCGVAPRARGVAATLRRARLLSAVTRRRGRDRAAGDISPRARRLAAGAARRHAARAPRDRRRLPARYRAAARAVPLRAGRLQARLGAGRADPLARARVRAGGDRAPGRDARRDRRVGARAVARWRGRAAVRAGRATEPVRSDRGLPRAGTRRGRTATSRTARPST